MGRFQVGETVEFWSPYGAIGGWEKSEVTRIETAPSGEPLVSVRSSREPDGELGVPNTFLRKVVNREGVKYPPVVYPANEFMLTRVDFPQGWGGDGIAQAIKFVFTLENTWTGEGRKIEVWMRSSDDGDGPEVDASMTWGFNGSDRNQRCSVNCPDANCGTSGFHYDVQRVARSSAGLTVVLQGELDRGRTHEEALDSCHAKFTLEADQVVSTFAAELSRSNREAIFAGDSINAQIAERLGIDPKNVRVIDLGESKFPNN